MVILIMWAFVFFPYTMLILFVSSGLDLPCLLHPTQVQWLNWPTATLIWRLVENLQQLVISMPDSAMWKL